MDNGEGISGVGGDDGDFKLMERRFNADNGEIKD